MNPSESSQPNESSEPSEPTVTLELNPTTTKAPGPAATNSVDSDPIDDPIDMAPTGFDAALFDAVDPGLAPFVDRATADLASRLGVQTSSIQVASATLVTWPNSAMGCPAPDMQYLQALQDGSLIELAHDGTFYRYHSGGDRQPFLCEARLAVAPTVSS